MKITYAGTLLGAEAPQGGTDIVQGFALPKAEQAGQWATGLRSPDAEPMARMNRERTLSGTIIPVTAATMGAAQQARQEFYETLAFFGALVQQEDANVTTFLSAVLKSIDIAEQETKGISYGLRFTFWVGPPAFTTIGQVLGTGNSGEVLGTGVSGQVLGTGQ